MADNRSITITLQLTQAGAGGGGNQANTANQTNLQAAQNQNSQNRTARAAYTAMAFQACEIAVNEIAAWAEYYWDRALTLNDDYIGQRNKNIAMTQISRGVNALTTIGSFAAMGAGAGGGIGAAVGALIGTAVATASIARSNVQGQDQQNIQLRQMDMQLQYTRSRAGWSLTAASIGEDL